MSSNMLRVAGLAVVAACHTSTPQSPLVAPSSTVLTGEWLATIRTRNVDDFQVFMTFARSSDSAYEAYSRSGALRQTISWRQHMLGRLFKKLPPHLAAFRLEDIVARPAGDSAVVRGKFTSLQFGTLWLAGGLRGGVLQADLRQDSTGRPVGSFRAARTESRVAVRDYVRLARELRDTTAAYIFDPRMMQTPAWRGFFQDLHERFADARDDADAIVAFYALLPRLGTSHFQFTHDPRLFTMSVDSALMRVSAPPESLVTLTFPGNGVAYMLVRRWERVSRVVDRAFARIDSAQAHTLILDIRGNPGGDQSSLALAEHLLRDTTYAGALLGNRWYREHPLPPTPAEMTALPETSKDDLLSTFRMLRQTGVVGARLTPRPPHFSGKVFLLINGGSGSASEPLAYLLSTTRRATLVGERTPGAILAAVPHPIREGWVLFLPEGDYYTAEGIRLEGRGVAPDVQVPAADAMLAVADSLRARMPYTAAMLSAQGAIQWISRPNLAAERYALAERWAREAIRLGPDSIAAINLVTSALVAQQRWTAGLALFDSLVTADSSRSAALYQIGRFAAMSGERLDLGERALRAYLGRPVPRGGAGYGPAHWRLGMILEKKGDRAAALREYEAGLAVDPKNQELIAAAHRLGAGTPR